MLTKTKERRPPLDTAAAATYIGAKPNYLEKLRCNGDGPTYIKLNGLVRYDPDDLDAWLKAGKRTSTSKPRDAGTLYDVVDGKRRWARIKDGKVHGLYYSAEKPEFAPGYIVVPVTHEDSEPFDITQHWRLKPECALIDADGTPVRVVCTYPVVPKSAEWA